MKSDPKKFASFVGKMKERIKVPGGTSVSVEQILKRQQEAWDLVYGISFEEFDAAWGEWVLDTYSKK